MNSEDSTESLPESARRVARLLAQIGHDKPVVLLPQTAATAADAAAGLRCELAQIAKSIVFRRVEDAAPVLVITSGVNRVDERKIAVHVGRLARADAQFVRENTGFVIGGVCPIGHVNTPRVLIDSDLMQLDSLWAAAGHPHAVFNLTPQQLLAMTGATVADVAAR
jgi:prolyl-tRNA editing enzyme YbaK/EbsC (Cys-tRNA(Pro) deacylase)